jgi:hypothetical protein
MRDTAEKLYNQTSSELAVASGVGVPTILKYAKAGKLDAIRISIGWFLFAPGQEQLVRELRDAGLRSCGLRRA